MTTDQGPVVQSALLRNELVSLRKQKGLTQENVAAKLEWSPSKLIRVEGGKNAITKVDLDALLNVYGVTSERDRERLQTLNRGARTPGWWNEFRGDISPTYLSFVGYETGASVIRQFHGTVVPGLLQTPEYAEVLTVGAVPPVVVAPVVKLRLRRQAELAKRAVLPRRSFIVDEAVIRRHVGIKRDPAIMPNQLRHIIDSVESSDLVTFRVIPFSAGAHDGLKGPFTLLEFEGGLSDILYLDLGIDTSMALVTDIDPVSEYADRFESLVAEALSPDASLELLRQVIEDLS